MEEARKFVDNLESESYITGGENDGFDCGSYPREYSHDTVKGKDVVFVVLK